MKNRAARSISSTSGAFSRWMVRTSNLYWAACAGLLFGGVQLHGIFPGRPAGVAAEGDDDDADGQREGEDADDHVAPVDHDRIDDLLLHRRRRIAADARHARRRR